jgi:hypothetical protein
MGWSAAHSHASSGDISSRRVLVKELSFAELIALSET